MNLRDRQRTAAVAFVYLDGVGYASRAEHGRDPVRWTATGMETLFSRARMLAAVLHSLGVRSGVQLPDQPHHWLSQEHAKRLGKKIGRHRGLFVASRLKPPESPEETWEWLQKLLCAFGLDIDLLDDEYLRIQPRSLDDLLSTTELEYRRFSPRGAYQTNWSQIAFLDFGLGPRPDLSRRWWDSEEE